MKSLINKADKTALDEAVIHELTAQNMYRYFANCMQRNGYFGFQKFFLAEAEDEGKHYQKVANFVNDLGDEVKIGVIPAQEYEGETPKEIFSHAFDAENALKEFYEELYTSSADPSVKEFVLKMVGIQRKAVGEYLDILATLDRCGEDKAALLVVDGRYL